jgi:hypothetical protein
MPIGDIDRARPIDGAPINQAKLLQNWDERCALDVGSRDPQSRCERSHRSPLAAVAKSGRPPWITRNNEDRFVVLRCGAFLRSFVSTLPAKFIVYAGATDILIERH